MTGLSDADRADWETRGFLAPRRALAPRDAAASKHRLSLRVRGARLARLGQRDRNEAYHLLQNRHAEWPELAALVRLRPVAELVQQILGPELVVWRTNLFFGVPKTPWHRDRYDRLLSDGASSVSALVALSPGTHDNCTLVLPGSHRWSREQLAAHQLEAALTTDTHAWGNERFGGAPPETAVERVNLQPGEFFVFHPHLVHASAATFARRGRREQLRSLLEPRIAFALRVTNAEARVRPEAFEDVLPRLSGPVLLPASDSPAASAFYR